MNLHFTEIDPGTVRTSVTVRRFGEAKVLSHEGPEAERDDTATRLLLEGIISKLDRFGARAFDIPAHHRHERHVQALETFTEGISYMNPPVGPPTLQACLPMLRSALAVSPWLLGLPAYPEHQARRDEYVELRSLCFTLAARLDRPGASCPICLLPVGHNECRRDRN